MFGKKKDEKKDDKKKDPPKPEPVDDKPKDAAFARKSVHKKDGKPEPAAVALPAKATHVEQPPVADSFHKFLGAPLVHKEKRADSSRFRTGPREPLEKLPLLKDAKAADREDLLIRKLRQCSQVFDFTDALGDLKSKEIKRGALVEIVDLIKVAPAAVTPKVYGDVVTMFAANLFRALPPPSVPPGIEFDPEEDEPALEPAWPHVQLVYELFLKFLEMREFDVPTAKTCLDQKFVASMLELFDSEDPRERDYLKTLLHRLYAKLLHLRTFIRQTVNHIFHKFIFEKPGTHNGIAELLEIFGSIVNGFTLPLKEEHKTFLMKVLLPLHIPKTLGNYHPQLAYCVVQFLEKDPTLTNAVVTTLLRYWPKMNSPKEVLFIMETEEIMDIIEPSEFETIMIPLCQRLASCVSSSHFQVAERALYLFNNQRFAALVAQHSEELLPIFFTPLHTRTKHHWNRTIVALVFNTMRTLNEINQSVYEACQQRATIDEQIAQSKLSSRNSAWDKIEAAARLNPLAKTVPVVQPPIPGQTLKFTRSGTGEVTEGELTGGRTGTNLKIRRKSFLPHDVEVAQALESYKPHGVGADGDE
eukprot:m.61155 g.61155  ORF g.61155 m.61155 type:complete len:586 (-) comp49424_c0_seq1:328-2085(-)